MPTTFEILKRRWPEVVLLIAFALFGSLGIKLLGPDIDANPSPGDAIVTMGAAVFYVMQMILQLGFVRTSYLEGDKPQEPMVLLRTGSRFFWRLFLFSMMYAGMYLTLGFGIFYILKAAGFIKAEAMGQNVWIEALCLIISSLILVKIKLLMPALIIVRDCGLVASIRGIRNFKILSAREPLVLFVILQAITYIAALLAPAGRTELSGNYAYVTCFTILASLITLAISVSTVRFAAMHMPYSEIRVVKDPAYIPGAIERDKEFEP